VSNRRGSITVGVDIGTTSVKALAVDEKGEVVARSRVAHRVLASEPDQLRHDARRAWRAGPQKAFAELSAELASTGNGDIAGLAVAAMVPSLTAVNRGGVPTLPGLLYGDLEGRPVPSPEAADDANGADDADAGPGMPDAEGFLRWAHALAPQATAWQGQ
jgi:xylulokinase